MTTIYKGYNSILEETNDPFIVRKTIYEQTHNDDQHYQLIDNPYIKYISKTRDIQESNPYVPRTYNFSYSSNKFQIEIEKLEKVYNISEEELNFLNNSLFVREIHKTKYIHITLSNIDLLMMREQYEQINDNKLIELARMITRLKKSNRYYHYDFSPENFMIRRGKFGIQLVITDPLS